MRMLCGVLGILLVGCDGSNLKDVALLGDLRVLALVVDTPEVAPGATVNVTPFVSDIGGGGRALTYSAEGCADPGLQLGAPLSCDDRPDRVVLGTDQPLPLAAPNYTGNAPAIPVTVPVTILDNRTPVVQANGYAYLVFFTVKAPGGVALKSFKRIFASVRVVKNLNPVVASATSNGAALGALPSAMTALVLNVTPASKEAYTQLDSDGATVSKTEEPLVVWFASDGKLDERQGPDGEAAEWTPPTTAPTTRNVLLVAVVRDRRGGDAVFTYAFP